MSGSQWIARCQLVAVAAFVAAELASMFVSQVASASASGPIDAVTGAPTPTGTELTCFNSCHKSFAPDSGPGLLEILGPESYVPGEVYEITVSLSHDGQSRWGFELTAIDDELLLGAGNFVPLNRLTKVSTAASNRQYIKQGLFGTAPNHLDFMAWTFDWMAPEEDVGSISFYAAGNAANFNRQRSGDYIYTAVLTVPEPPAKGLALAAFAALLGLRLRGQRASACVSSGCGVTSAATG